jgi:hypothetical protein
MNEQCIRSLKEDFLEWSGGTPPDSEEQIFIYLEFAGPSNVEDDFTRKVLREWMDEGMSDQGR